MSEAISAVGVPAHDTAQLKQQLRRAERARQGIAIALVAPLFLYLVVNFVVPVSLILFKSVDDREVSSVLVRTTEAIVGWNGEGLPDEAVFAALVSDLRDAQAAKMAHIPSKRLNAAKLGFQALLLKTARELPSQDSRSFKTALIEMNEKWGETVYWAAIKRTSRPVTAEYLLAAFDLRINELGEIVRAPEHLRVFNDRWVQTFWMGLVITFLCVVMGYPLAYLLAHLPTRISNLLMILVLLPFWVSILVRTTAWIVLLQNEGVLNDLGLYLGLWTERLQLIRNRFGVYLVMSHVLLPYMVLTLYGVMKRIPPEYLRAAQSLGANPIVAFVRIYVPLTIHGIGAGALFVFILAVGFYITPALVGGPKDQMISFYVAFYASESLNWGAAAALGSILLLFTVALYFVMDRVFGISKLRMQRA